MSETNDDMKTAMVEDDSQETTAVDPDGATTEVITEAKDDFASDDGDAAVLDFADGQALGDSVSVEEASDVKEAVNAEEVNAAEAASADSDDDVETAQVPAPVEVGQAPAPKKATGIGDLIAVGVLSLVLGVLLALPTFLGTTSAPANSSYDLAGGVAATVNGVSIGENDVTKQITALRTQSNLQDDAIWGQFLVDNDLTPALIRNDVVKGFTTQELIMQAAADQDVKVTDSQIDEQYALMVSQMGGEQQVTNMLQQSGMTVEDVRESIRLSLLQEALLKKLGGDAEVSDEEVLNAIKQYDPEAVDAGATSLEGVDEQMVSYVRNALAQNKQGAKYSEWMTDFQNKAEITVNDMPQGLPYDVDLSSFTKSASQSASSSDAAVEVQEDTAETSGQSAASSASSESK